MAAAAGKRKYDNVASPPQGCCKRPPSVDELDDYVTTTMIRPLLERVRQRKQQHADDESNRIFGVWQWRKAQPKAVLTWIIDRTAWRLTLGRPKYDYDRDAFRVSVALYRIHVVDTLDSGGAIVAWKRAILDGSDADLDTLKARIGEALQDGTAPPFRIAKDDRRGGTLWMPVLERGHAVVDAVCAHHCLLERQRHETSAFLRPHGMPSDWHGARLCAFKHARLFIDALLRVFQQPTAARNDKYGPDGNVLDLYTACETATELNEFLVSELRRSFDYMMEQLIK